MPPAHTKPSLSADVSELNTSVSIAADTIQVDDKLYSTKILADIHPGGELFVKAFSGRDATEAFMSYHRRKFPHNSIKGACIGNAPKSADTMKDYLELCAIVEKVIPRHKSFAPASYYFKVLAIVLAVVGTEAYIHYTGNYVWYLTAPLGFFMALVGLNIQHDANHGAISKYPVVNRIFGLSQNWIGGSSIDWIHQHVVQHHLFTNDVHNDPDIRGSEILRLNPLKPLMHYHIVQHIYVFFLILIFGIIMILSSFAHVLAGENMTKMSTLLPNERMLDTLSSVVFFFRWFVLPLYQKFSIYTLMNIFPMFVVGGYYLAFFFIISHNFEGVVLFDQTKRKSKSSFLYDQVVTSSNVGGAWLCFLNGGLNYQIEHHLFPRMQHTHYPRIAPIVKKFCEERNIRYNHFPTVYDNFIACVKHLRTLGSTPIPSAFVQ